MTSAMVTPYFELPKASLSYDLTQGSSIHNVSAVYHTALTSAISLIAPADYSGTSYGSYAAENYKAFFWAGILSAKVGITVKARFE